MGYLQKINRMIKDIISLTLKDIVFLIKENPEFFQENKTSREGILKKSKELPKSISEYLVKVEESKVLEDIKSIVTLVTSEDQAKSDLTDAIVEYLTSDLIEAVDKYYAGGSIEKAYLSDELSSYLKNYTEQEVTTEIYSVVSKFKEIPLIIVQLSAEGANKTSIRKHFSKDFPCAVVEFQQNSDLLGGIKVFVNGEVKDYSWASKVKSLELVQI